MASLEAMFPKEVYALCPICGIEIQFTHRQRNEGEWGFYYMALHLDKETNGLCASYKVANWHHTMLEVTIDNID